MLWLIYLLHGLETLELRGNIINITGFFSMLTIVVLLVLTASEACRAEQIKGTIVAVTDGDTVTLLNLDHKQIRIRLMGIDAPEKRQPYGNVCRKMLSDLIYTKEVVADYNKADYFGRLIAKLTINGVDVNLRQISKGCAWHYKRYASEQSDKDREAYSAAEVQARKDKIRIWKDANPTAPWTWRRSQGGSPAAKSGKNP